MGCVSRGIAARPIIRPAQATDDIASIGIVDYVLLCVKLWDVETAGQQIRPIVGPPTAVVPLQNGVDAADRLIPILGHEPVMGGSAFVTATIVAPGVIRQTSTYQQMTFGELDGRVSPRGESSAICALRPASRGSSAPISGRLYGRSSWGWCRSAASTR
jgi:2-dehydropantoate 2-reductase